jgi:CRISPR system Cascade subunit CasC
VEIRNKKMPVSYANAFVKPVTAGKDKDLIEASVEQFARHADVLNRKYGLQAEPRLWFCTEPIRVPETRECESFDALLDGVARAVGVR